MIKTKLLATALALSLTTPALAKDVVLYAQGAWRTVINTNDQGQPMCLMSIYGSDSQLHVKYTTGAGIFLHLFKNSWKIPNGTKINGWAQFDNDPSFQANGVGGTNKAGQSYIQYYLEKGTEAKFLGDFAEANIMRLGFDQGNEPPFSMDMTGSRNAAKMFLNCAEYIDKHQPTQPFDDAKSKPTQPFGDKPVKTETVKPAPKDDGGI